VTMPTTASTLEDPQCVGAIRCRITKSPYQAGFWATHSRSGRREVGDGAISGQPGAGFVRAGFDWAAPTMTPSSATMMVSPSTALASWWICLRQPRPGRAGACAIRTSSEKA